MQASLESCCCHSLQEWHSSANNLGSVPLKPIFGFYNKCVLFYDTNTCDLLQQHTKMKPGLPHFYDCQGTSQGVNSMICLWMCVWWLWGLWSVCYVLNVERSLNVWGDVSQNLWSYSCLWGYVSGWGSTCLQPRVLHVRCLTWFRGHPWPCPSNV